jgi:hypothetical protein
MPLVFMSLLLAVDLGESLLPRARRTAEARFDKWSDLFFYLS